MTRIEDHTELYNAARQVKITRKKVNDWLKSEALKGELCTSEDSPYWQEFADAANHLYILVEDIEI